MGNFVKVVGVAVVDIWGGGFGGRDYQTRKKGEFLWLRLFLLELHLHTKSADIKPKCSKSLNGPKVIKKPECFFPKICSKIVTSKIGCLPVCKAEKPLICLLSDSRITNKRGLFTSDYFQSQQQLILIGFKNKIVWPSVVQPSTALPYQDPKWKWEQL